MRKIFITLAGCLALAACGGEQHSDLKQFVKDSDNLPRGRIPPLPEAKPYGSLQPDFSRRREPLEAYPLENLKMVGTLQQKKDIFALIRTPDSNLFRVKAGNYMGQNFGRIGTISESNIKLKEIVQDSTGSWEEKEQMLQLQDEQEAKK